jgi:hypothetical protein
VQDVKLGELPSTSITEELERIQKRHQQKAEREEKIVAEMKRLELELAQEEERLRKEKAEKHKKSAERLGILIGILLVIVVLALTFSSGNDVANKPQQTTQTIEPPTSNTPTIQPNNTITLPPLSSFLIVAAIVGTLAVFFTVRIRPRF